MKNLNLLLFKVIISLFLGYIAICLSGCSGSSGKIGEKMFKPVQEVSLRAPAYPLVTIDPYTSAWSFTDKLNEDIVRHWTGKKFPLLGALRVDGISYRFMGDNEIPLETILPTAATLRWDATYTEKQPTGNWMNTDYNDKNWEQGKAAFGTRGQPNLSTRWNTKEIWVRRSFNLSQDYTDKKIILEYSHDDIFELYINGIQVVATDYSWNNNVMLELPDEVKKTLVVGANSITAHCQNLVGGAYVDFGLFYLDETVKSFDNPAIQKSVNVLPTQTFYSFSCGPVELDVIFTAPLLMDDLVLMSTPINFISYQVRPTDGKTHDVQIYIEATPNWAVNMPEQEITSFCTSDSCVLYAKTGTIEQPVLQKKGDDVRIDWGYFYVASVKKSSAYIQTDLKTILKDRFIDGGFTSLAGSLESKKPFYAQSRFFSQSSGSASSSALAFCEDLGAVTTTSEGFMMIGYDDILSIQYFRENRPGYWRRHYKKGMLEAFKKAGDNYASIMRRCAAFDKKMLQDVEKVGGKEYAALCALAYRQSVSAHKLIEDKDGNLIFLSKENFSNGSIGTVDITYPSSPLFLIFNTELLKGMMRPIFYFSESGLWKKPFPSHDVGTYPQANGQTYGGDMPVEESGNMLILTTAISLIEGNAHFAKQHWETLTTWVEYLMKEGLDPENQLCTDDFAGHLAHNANLSIKAILGIAGYGKMAEMLGNNETAKKYIQAAKDMAKQWTQMADNNDHYRLTFDNPDTWSQKYNLIWDKLFGLNIFPKEVAKKEVAYYLTKQNKYGLPLDIRKDYTKTDWIIWSACLADNDADFRQLMLPVHVYANETVSRIPLSDWHDTKDSRSVGFRARSVVGGYFMKLLEKKMTTNR